MRMQPLEQIKRDRKSDLWAPEPLQIPAPGSLEHSDEGLDVPVEAPEKPPGSHVIVIDIS